MKPEPGALDRIAAGEPWAKGLRWTERFFAHSRVGSLQRSFISLSEASQRLAGLRSNARGPEQSRPSPLRGGRDLLFQAVLEAAYRRAGGMNQDAMRPSGSAMNIDQTATVQLAQLTDRGWV